MTSVGETVEPGSWRVNPPAGSVVFAVVRRLLPYLVEATLLPTVAYYCGLLAFGHVWGIAAAVSCTSASVARRLLLRQPVPGLLILASVGISIRAAMFFVNESSFLYFVQPIVKTAAISLLFAASVIVGRPLVARFAADFCNFESDVGSRPAIAALFRRLTCLWAGAQFTIAAVDLTLLLTVPVAVFVGTAAATAWVVMTAGVVITVIDAIRTTRGDGIGTALAFGGRLHAYIDPAI